MLMCSSLRRHSHQFEQWDKLSGQIDIIITIEQFRSNRINELLNKNVDRNDARLKRRENNQPWAIDKEEFDRYHGVDCYTYGLSRLSKINKRIKYLWKNYGIRREKIEFQAKTTKITLSLEQVSRSGIVMFRVNANEEVTKEFETLSKDLYKQVKSHFHEDHFHDSGILFVNPIFFNEECDINRPDNKVLLHYISSSNIKFEDSINNLYSLYQPIDVNPYNKLKKRHSKEIIQKRYAFYDECYKIIGQRVFVQILLDADQNKCCHVDRGYDIDGTDYRKVALGLSNVKNAVEALKNRTKHHHDEEKLRINERTTRHNTQLAWLSVGLGAISLIASWDSISKLINSLKDLLLSLYLSLITHL